MKTRFCEAGKWFRLTILLWPLICAVPGSAQTNVNQTNVNQNPTPTYAEALMAKRQTGAWFLYSDSQRDIDAAAQKLVGSPQTVQKMPVFDNAPFLKLKPGDSLVKGRRWNPNGKGRKAAFANVDAYFLLSGGNYYDLQYFGLWSEVPKQDNGLVLRSPKPSLLLNWEVDRARAAQLKSMVEPELGRSVSLQSYRSIRTALRAQFAEILGEEETIKLPQPYLDKTNQSAHRVVFHGLGYDSFFDTIYIYRLEIGLGVLQQWRKNLIVGPPRVEREEFEGRKGGGINSGMPYKPDAQTAAKKRAEYERMQEFQRTVEKFLPARPHIGAFN